MDYGDLKSTIELSKNLYFIGDIFKSFGIDPLKITHYNPVWESLFNFVVLWALIFLPYMLVDEKSRKMNKTLWWGLGWFSTNIAFIPFFALRSAIKTDLFDFQLSERSKYLPRWSSILGFVSLIWTGFFIWYGLGYGDQTLEERK